MSDEIRVPSQAASVFEAVRKAQEESVEIVKVIVEEDFREPAEAWPLELQAPSPTTKGGGGFRSLEVVGPPGRTACLHDIALEAAGPVGSGATVTLRGFSVRGQVSLNGQGCILEDCEVRNGIEIQVLGAAAVRQCSVGPGRRGIHIRGRALVEDVDVQSCDIGICVLGNLPVIIRNSRFSKCAAAAIVVHCSLPRGVGSVLRLAPTIERTNSIDSCGHSHELLVQIDGAQPLIVNEWPLPAATTYTVLRLRGGSVQIEAISETTLQVVDEESTGKARPKRRKRQKCTTSAEKDDTAYVTAKDSAPVIGPAWARDALGIDDSEGILTEEKVRHAYRYKAREVHPDKHPETLGEDVCDVKKTKVRSAKKFHRVTAAREALLLSLTKTDESPCGTGEVACGSRSAFRTKKGARTGRVRPRGAARAQQVWTV
eukprot:TRINITY_DN77113_c0_g1_i1.p1 TRINITY_DN77113_c0_g1~~TRINITY_DN77113_c0_g1_i1.p1  ORF type:complete len:429 (-),score=65.26 TRINITY_DN77113_c0_g1_i1:49-1335(-)